MLIRKKPRFPPVHYVTKEFNPFILFYDIIAEKTNNRNGGNTLDREDFRKWLFENCLKSTGVWLLFGKAGGRKKRIAWMVGRLNLNLKPM